MNAQEPTMKSSAAAASPGPSSSPPPPLVHLGQPQAPYDDDEHSGELREYNGVFEGPEKTLEVVFRRIPGLEHLSGLAATDDEASLGDDAASIGSSGTSNLPHTGHVVRTGLRALPRSDLDRICARARCSILSRLSNRYLDAYVLSESSLFVYPRMIVLKTCGTTTLLRCVAALIELGKKVGLEVDWLGYSRKNFSYPGDQAFPHGSFHQEMEYLYSHKSLCERLDGNGYTLGPVTGDHWFVFVADHTRRASPDGDHDADRVLNIMMFDIDQDVAQKFYYDRYEARTGPDESEDDAVRRISDAQTDAAGIRALVPGAAIDARAFEPCGYSMNAILFHSYSTMHITPEEGSSYASFETNQKVKNYAPLVGNVVRTFRPRRFVMTLMADDGGMVDVGKNLLFGGNASEARIAVPFGSGKAGAGGNVGTSAAAATYRRKDLASIKVEDDQTCIMGNWVLEEGFAKVGGSVDVNIDATVREASGNPHRGRGLSVSHYS